MLDNAHLASKDVKNPLIIASARRSGDFICFDIEDNGRGFPEEGFPTKSDWGSTGIGLAFVSGVVKIHDGRIKIYNRPQGGACVTLSIPLWLEV